MKVLNILVAIFLFFPLASRAQSQLYAVPVVAVDQYLRDSVHVIGRLDLDFPQDGKVFVQFDGEGFGDTLDRIILAANIYPDWDTNDGNVSFVSNTKGEGNCFSHTRTFSVTAGQHSFYAVAHNYVDIEGSGIASVFGTLSVEYIPQNSDVIGESSITTDEYEAVLPVAYDSVTIETTGPGKVEVRLNGNIDCNFGDIMVVAVTDTKNWNYTDANGLALESTNPSEYYVGFSTTQVFDVPGAGTYTYYAMAQRGYEEEGNGYIYAYTNLHARYYPAASEHIVLNKKIHEENLNLDAEVTLLDSIVLNITKPGKVQVRFDGALQSSAGNKILLAVNNSPAYELQEGSVVLQSPNEDIDRHPFIHTQVFGVEPGTHTFYVMAQHYQGSGSTSVDLNGNFLVKYYPESLVATDDHVAALPFAIWPNPAKDQIIIQTEEANDKLEISIFDLQGRRVQQMQNMFTAEEMKVTSLLPGMYMVQVCNGKETGFKKMVKE